MYLIALDVNETLETYILISFFQDANFLNARLAFSLKLKHTVIKDLENIEKSKETASPQHDLTGDFLLLSFSHASVSS